MTLTMSGGTKETFQVFEDDDAEELEFIPNVPFVQWHNNQFMLRCGHSQSGNKCYCKLTRRWAVLTGLLLAFASIYYFFWA